MPTSLVLALPALAPLAAALLALARPVRPLAPALAAGVALPAVAVALLAPDARADLPWLLLGARLRLDGPSRTFLLLTGMVWLAAAVHAAGYLAHDRRRAGFAAFWSLALAGNAGLVLAGDAATFYLCFALMSFASYGLVVHDGTPSAVRAGKVYLALVVAGEVAVFAALAAAAASAGSAGFDEIRAALPGSPWLHLVVAMALAGFGVKAGALGLHVWLPLAHPEAPTPASAVLSGVMVKAGLVGWLNLLPGDAALPGLGRLALVLGLAGAFYGVAVGLTQRNPKAILAYSTVSQMGLLAAGFGAALAGGPARALAWQVLPAFALHHGIAKGALFLGAGVAQGGGKAGRLATPALALPALALAAAPFTSGALAKGGLKALVGGSPVGGPAALLLLSLSSAGTAILLAHLLRVLASGAGRAPTGAPAGHAAGRLELLAFAALVAAALALPLAAGGGPNLAAGAAKDLWPIAAGAAVAAALWSFPTPAVPTGDVLVLYEAVGRRALRPLREAEPVGSSLDGHGASGGQGWVARASAWAGGSEARLGAAAARGLSFALLVVALGLLLRG